MKKLYSGISLALFGFSTSVFAITALAADHEARSQDAISTLDSDGDGVVSFAEFQEGESRGLSRLDSDQDGVITMDEFLNSRPGPRMRNRDQNDGDRPQLENREERRAEMQEMMAQCALVQFQEMDLDGDETVSIDEFQQASFLRLDRDNNGVLTAEEIRPPRRHRRGDRAREERRERLQQNQ